MGIHVGIDFGTSTISASIWQKEKRSVYVLPMILKQKGPVINSIYYTAQDKQVMGVQADRRATYKPQFYVTGIKRELNGNGWSRRIFEEQKTAEEVCLDIFRIIAKNIERQFAGDTIESAVVTVPFAFSHMERQKIRNAAIDAGLPVVALLEEPVSAALASGLFDEGGIQYGENILIFDFGGGTLDMTIFTKNQNEQGQIEIEVITTDGDRSLGGKDIDQLLFNKLLEHLNIDLATKGLDENVHKFKVKLQMLATIIKHSFMEQDEIYEYFVDPWGNGHDIRLTYNEFAKWLDLEITQRLDEIIEDLLDEIHMFPSQIDHIVMVGGSSNLRPVQQKLQQIFNKALIVPEDIHTLVAKGAGIYCGMLQDGQSPFKIKQKVSHHVGYNLNGKMQPVLLRNTPYGQWSNRVQVQSQKIGIYQGNSPMLDHCTKIGHLDVVAHVNDLHEVYLKMGSDVHGILSFRLFKKEDLLLEEQIMLRD